MVAVYLGVVAVYHRKADILMATYGAIFGFGCFNLSAPGHRGQGHCDPVTVCN